MTNHNMHSMRCKTHYQKNKDKISKKHKEYYEIHKKERREYNKTYYENNRDVLLKQHRGYCKSKRGIKTTKEYEKSNAYREKNKRYRQSTKGKISDIKHKVKRRYGLIWIQMFNNPFDDVEKVDWHHITDAYVVAIPRDLHRLYCGKFHREKTMEIVKQIYLTN